MHPNYCNAVTWNQWEQSLRKRERDRTRDATNWYLIYLFSLSIIAIQKKNFSRRWYDLMKWKHTWQKSTGKHWMQFDYSYRMTEWDNIHKIWSKIRLIDKLIKTSNSLSSNPGNSIDTIILLTYPFKSHFFHIWTSTPTTREWFISIVFMFQFLGESTEEKNINWIASYTIYCNASTLN